MEAVRGQKHPSEAEKGMKKVFDKSFLNNLKNPLSDPIRFELQPQSTKRMIFEANDLHISNSRTKTEGLDS
jgi:hypothetical protein